MALRFSSRNEGMRVKLLRCLCVVMAIIDQGILNLMLFLLFCVFFLYQSHVIVVYVRTDI